MSEVVRNQSKHNKVSVAYQLFRYQEQLRCRQSKKLNLYKVKYNIINIIVAKTWNNIKSYSQEEREHFFESMVYKKKLKETLETEAARSSKRKKTPSSNKSKKI